VFLPVNAGGLLDLDALGQAVTPDTALVSLMGANNETGVLWPIGEIAGLVKSRGALFHCDAVQLAGKEPFSLRTLPADYLTISGHKFHGPKGAGALYVARGAPFTLLLFGGMQEFGRRAGDLPEPVIRPVPGLARGLATPAVVAIGGRRYFLEPFAARDSVLICGAGHIARPTAQIAAMAGFRVIVLDDREEFANPARFPWADEVALLPSFHDCFAGRTLDADTSVVIVSRCHKQDRTILTQALRTEAGYIGMIGSSRKVAAVLEEQIASGVPRARVAAVHAPIGLPIGGDMPVEIAVSIMAELIKERTRRQEQALAKAS
jgi:xanthine/CO dehydrogenase XdhC/CoxF family maturation factor